MSKRLSPSAVIRFFSGEEDSLSEIIFDGSDDELGMEDEEPLDYEPPFESLEVDHGKTIIYIIMHIMCVCVASKHNRYISFPTYIDLEVNGDTR